MSKMLERSWIALTGMQRFGETGLGKPYFVRCWSIDHLGEAARGINSAYVDSGGG